MATTHRTGTREQWLAERVDLLAQEKELTRRGDEIARRRQELPWVRVDKRYELETEQGRRSLDELFGGRSQLLVYHFMFGPDYKAGCPSCSSIADGFDGIFVHLINHDVAFTAISRAPIARLLAYRQRMGWDFPWASSADSDFNTDFNVFFTPEQEQAGTVEYNFQRQPAFQWRTAAADGGAPVQSKFAAMCGTDVPTYRQDRPGLSAFARQDGVVYHTYSSYGRGVDAIWGVYPWLDRAPLGRNESGGPWWKRHDEYTRA
jgi:predicted dithiol-disulfide oxidoreductase (DUF899 family)